MILMMAVGLFRWLLCDFLFLFFSSVIDLVAVVIVRDDKEVCGTDSISQHCTRCNGGSRAGENR